MSYIRAKVTADDAVPMRIEILVKRLSDERGNVFLNAIASYSLSSYLNGVVFHFICHVNILDVKLARLI